MRPRPIKVLFLIDYFHSTGGTEKHLAQLVCWLAARDDFHVEVVVFDLGKNPLIDEMRAAGAIIHHIRVEREYGTKAFRGAFELMRLMRRERFDIVQTFHQKSDTYGAFIARLAGVPHIVSSKRDTGQGRKAYHFFLNRRLRFLFERTIVVADAVADSVVATNHLDRASLVKIYNGVDSEKFAPPDAAQALEARARFGLGAQDFVVGMVAGFRPEKNQRTLLEGARAAHAHIPGLKILLVGDGPLMPQMRLEYSGDPAVIFAGDVKDVWNVLKAMDVGCLLSANEGFSNAIVEQMSAGLPMIVTDTGGNAEAVVRGESGYVIAAGDARACTAALLELAADQERRHNMGRRSRQLVLEKFSLRQMCERHARLYGELCGVTASADGRLSSPGLRG